MIALKQLALRIAVLAPKDQEWLLAQLSTAEQQRIAPLVQEAIELDLHRHPDLLGSMAESVASPHHHRDDVQLQAKRDALHPFWKEILGTDTMIRSETSLKGTEQNRPDALRRCILDCLQSEEAANV